MGYALPPAISGIAHLDIDAAAAEGAGVFLAANPTIAVLAETWPVLVTLLFAGLGYALKGRGLWYRRLAAMYLEPGDVNRQTKLWLPGGNKR
ncbi:hypothetical protein PU560_09380 [Georgenia sp. 10Sc9-8]|uniref:Uncharacterized protein n=1 Tax=Georgenia halotolerans TaxID=3028317 RepID=A0ABT5TX77_9MICO|nr:hypothetical protein [Georgenia halotolerans]